MIHFALGVAAFLFIVFLVLCGIGFIIKGFEESKGCGCLALIAVIVATILLIAFFA